jgi:hypothetical protein
MRPMLSALAVMLMLSGAAFAADLDVRPQPRQHQTYAAPEPVQPQQSYQAPAPQLPTMQAPFFGGGGGGFTGFQGVNPCAVGNGGPRFAAATMIPPIGPIGLGARLGLGLLGGGLDFHGGFHHR